MAKEKVRRDLPKYINNYKEELNIIPKNRIFIELREELIKIVV